MGFSRQEYWSGLPFLSPGDLPNSGIEPRSPTLQADALISVQPGKPKHKKVLKDICSQMFLVLDVLVSIIHNSQGIETT